MLWLSHFCNGVRHGLLLPPAVHKFLTSLFLSDLAVKFVRLANARKIILCQYRFNKNSLYKNYFNKDYLVRQAIELIVFNYESDCSWGRQMVYNLLRNSLSGRSSDGVLPATNPLALYLPGALVL